MQNITRNFNKKAFTLIELMLTIGILAVALSMVAALFPVAVKESNESYRNIIGTLICENGLAVAKTILEDGDVTSTTGLQVIFDEVQTTTPGGNTFAKDSQHYNAQFEESGGVWENKGLRDGDLDAANNEKMRGFLVLGREVGAGNQLIVVSYARSSGNNVTAVPVSCSVTAGDTNITITNPADNGKLRIGSPLIDAATGYYATIIATNSARTTGTLDRQIHPATGTDARDVTSAFVIQESGVTAKSPAFAVLVTLTGLQN